MDIQVTARQLKIITNLNSTEEYGLHFLIDESTEAVTPNYRPNTIEYTSDAFKLIWRVNNTIETSQDDEQAKVQVRPDGSVQVSAKENKQSLIPDKTKEHWSDILKNILKELLV